MSAHATVMRRLIDLRHEGVYSNPADAAPCQCLLLEFPADQLECDISSMRFSRDQSTVSSDHIVHVNRGEFHEIRTG